MFFTSGFYSPKFSLTPYEKQIDKNILETFRFSSEPNQFYYQLELKKQASIMANNIHQLKEVPNDRTVKLLEDEISKAVLHCLEANFRRDTQLLQNKISLQNTFSLLESQIKENKVVKIISALNIVSNSLLFSVGSAGVILFSAVLLAPASWSITFLALGLTLLSTAVALFSAYSIYVDGKYLLNKQLKDLDKGINFLVNYPNLIGDNGIAPELSSNNFQTLYSPN